MNTLLRFSAALAPYLAATGSTQALISVATLAKSQARKMGIEVRSNAAGPKHVQVQIEFTRKGRLQKFGTDKDGRIVLRLRDSNKSVAAGSRTLLVAPLQFQQPKPGRVSVAIMARRDQVAHMSVMIHVMEGMSMMAFNLELKEFVDLADLDRRGAEVEGK